MKELRERALRRAVAALLQPFVKLLNGRAPLGMRAYRLASVFWRALKLEVYDQLRKPRLAIASFQWSTLRGC